MDRARKLLSDPDASEGDLNNSAKEMDQIGEDGLANALRNKAKEQKMQADLERVWSEQAKDKMKKFDEMLSSNDDSPANISRTEAAAQEAAKMAETARSQYRGKHADELEQYAKDLQAKADDLFKPDPEKVAAMEAVEKFRELMANDNALPDELNQAADEAAAWAARLQGNQKCAKEQRDCEQFVPQLRAKAAVQEKEIKRIIAMKYKLYPWMKMKNFLKKQGVPKAEVDSLLDKYSLWQLSKKKGIELPNDPKDL